MLIEARALVVNAIVRSLSMDLTFGLADISIQDLHTHFDDARYRVVAKSGRIHEATDAGAVDTASVPGCLSLGVSVFDRKSPGYKGTDVAYKATLGGFGVVCSAPLVHLCSKWATDAFRLHSAASNDPSVALPMSVERAETRSGTAVGAGDGITGSMSTHVSVGRLDVSFVTVEGGRCAQLGILHTRHLDFVSTDPLSMCSTGTAVKDLILSRVTRLRRTSSLLHALALEQVCWRRLGSRLSTDNL